MAEKIKGEWIANPSGGNDFMHSSSLDPVLSVTTKEVTIWGSIFSQMFADIVKTQGGMSKDKTVKVPDSAMPAYEEGKRDEKIKKKANL